MSKMSENFYKIKKKHLVWAIIKSLICGISFGLAVVGILLLALKLSAINFAVLYYVLIGIGAAIVGGGIAFMLLFRPTDKKVARRTDDDYKLNERVQTTLAYSDKEGTMVQLQREDTEEKIKSLPRRKFSFARIWRYCVVLVVALAIGAAGIFVPAKEAVGDVFVDPDSTPRKVTQEERDGVIELIADVRNSYLEDNIKSSVVAVLEVLLSDLDAVNTEGTLARAVNTAIDNSGIILSSTLSYVRIGAALSEADQPYMGQAITDGGNVYKYYKLTISDEARAFYAESYDATNAKVSKGLSSMRSNLAVSESNDLSPKLDELSTSIDTALTASQIATTNSLYSLLVAFNRNIASIKADVDRGMAMVDVQEEINDLMATFTIDLTYTVSTQAYNAAMKVFISNRLKTIFKYTGLEDAIPDPDKQGGSDTPGAGEDKDPDGVDPGGDGSGGQGKTDYGSDDKVWVPGVGYKPYGEIINDYYNLINMYLRSDELTEEQKNMIRAYYDILFGSNKNK